MLLKLRSCLIYLSEKEIDPLTYSDITRNTSALEVMYEEAEEDEKHKAYKELASLVLANAEESMRKLIASVHP
jgi:hypothetical protein